MVQTSLNNYLQSFMNIVNALCFKNKKNDHGETTQVEIDRITSAVELIFVYATTWSLGSNLDLVGRKIFNKLFIESITEYNHSTINANIKEYLKDNTDNDKNPHTHPDCISQNSILLSDESY